jgi:large subunit ribosomal protein L28
MGGVSMAKFCEVCGKGTISGNSITHSDRKIRRTWKPNVRRVTVLENGSSSKKYVCTRCLRSNKVQRAI